MKSKFGATVPTKAAANSASEARLSFAQVLLDRANAPDLRKTERTRLRLLASIAGRLSDGSEHTELRVADVAAAAGLGHGTFYRYFPDLRSAMEALVTDFAAFLHDQLTYARDGTSGSRNRVRGATLAYTRAFRANAGLMRCLISLSREDTVFSKAFQALNDGWNRRMASALARRPGFKSSPNHPPSLAFLPTAYALGGMIDEFLTQLYLRRVPSLSHLANDEVAVADLLTELWCLSAYGRLPPGGR